MPDKVKIVWKEDVRKLMDNAVFNLRMNEPLEPTKEQINEWVVLNLWKIVRELRKRDEGVS